MRASWVLFAAAFAEMTLDAEEAEEGIMSAEELELTAGAGANHADHGQLPAFRGELAGAVNPQGGKVRYRTRDLPISFSIIG